MTSQQGRERRFERWLVILAERLQSQADCRVELAARHEYFGDFLLLRVQAGSGFSELHVQKKKKGAVLILLAQSQAALQVWQRGLSSMYREISRIANAKRKFFHRLERMLKHLMESFPEQKLVFPQRALETLRALKPGAMPMIGVETVFRVKADTTGSFADAGSRKRLRRPYAVVFAAMINSPVDSVFYHVFSDSFPIELDEEKKESEADDVAEAVSDAFDVWKRPASDGSETFAGETASDAGDCGGLDTPDCGSFDVPDCSCDCSP